MDVHLSRTQEDRVAEALASGAFRSADEVIERALEMLHEQNVWLRENGESHTAKISRGVAELDRGEGIAEEELDGLLRNAGAQER